MPANPRMLSVTLTDANAHSLLTLLQAADATFNNLHNITAQWLQIQLSPTAGATHLYIGNSAVSSTNCGADLVAGQAWPGSAFDFAAYQIDLSNVYLLLGTATSTVINICVGF